MKLVPFAALLLVLAATVVAEEGSYDPDRVVATVNDEIILAREVIARVGPALARTEDPHERERLVDTQIRQLVRIALQRQEARRMGLVVSDKDVQTRVDEEAKVAEGKGRKLAELLAEQGITMEDYRLTIRSQILLDRFVWTKLGLGERPTVQNRPTRDGFVRPEEVQAYYRANQEKFRRPAEVRLRTIFIKAVSFLEPGMSMAEAKRLARLRAEDVLRRIEAGAEFALLAREFSQDSWRDKGGDQGLRRTEDLPEFLRDWAFDEDAPAVSGILETGAGCLIARADERHQARVMPFEEAQGPIKETLAVERRRRIIARVVLDLVEEADIRPEAYARDLRVQLEDELAR